MGFTWFASNDSRPSACVADRPLCRRDRWLRGPRLRLLSKCPRPVCPHTLSMVRNGRLEKPRAWLAEVLLRQDVHLAQQKSQRVSRRREPFRLVRRAEPLLRRR